MVSERDREALRACMPELLGVRCGVSDLRRSFRCPSPSHDDRDPSAHYYEDDHVVHCFGCGKTWDVFSLVGELDGIEGFAEQARAVAEAVGYSLDESPGEARPRPRAARPPRPPFEEPREAGVPDCLAAVRAAAGALYEPGNDVGRRYLRWRGLDDADAARFGLGFTRDPREVLPEFAVFEPEALGFITIPFFCDAAHSTANYCMARTVGRRGVRNKEWRPRGVASPLWNEWMLSASTPVLYVAEGLIDAMALSKITGGDAMALGGVANARRLGQVLHRTPRELRPGRVVVCMDEDDEGRRARDRVSADLDALGVPHVALPPYPGHAKDADEWLMDGRGVEWDYEERRAPDGGTLYYTRWL